VSEEIEVLRIVTERLEAAGMPYMVTGSMALGLYAVPRMTRDIDLVVELSTDDADRICALFAADFYVDADAVRASIAHRSTFNLIHEALVVKVDVVVRKDTDYRRTEFARRRHLTFEGHPLVVVAPEDLIISKLDWARDTRSQVQLADVRHLLRSVPGLDRAYIEQWIDRLDLASLYQEVRG
jgi:hypothetical protein